MKPLDDELRALLTSRADALPLVPDPVVGVERRARRMQRNRIAASVAGAALAVSAVAFAVPVLTGGSSSESLPPPVAESPSAEPAPQAASPYALDPADPWPYRGDPQAVENGNRETFAREWAAKHGYDEGEVTFTPLYGELYEPSAATTLVYVAQEPSGRAWWGVVQSSESGPELLLDVPLRSGATALPAALPAALPGDEVARLLVTASPEVGTIQYGPDGASAWVDLTSLAPGIGIGPLEGFPENDRVRVLDRDGAVVFDELAPSPEGGFVELSDPSPPAAARPSTGAPSAGEEPGTQAPPTPAPSNVVDWPVRGTVSNELFQQALRAFARVTGASPEAVDAKVLYAGSKEDRNVLLLQAWTRGEDARTFGYLEAAGNETTWLGQVTAPGPAALALLVPADAAFLPSDLLLVVPEPRAGQVLYSADGSSEPEPVADQGTEAAVLIERAPGARGDRLLVLDGNGDPDRPIYRGTVADLLAAS